MKIEDLDKLINFYEAQKDWVGGRPRIVSVWLSERVLNKIGRRAKDPVPTWIYRGYQLRRHSGSPND